MGRNARKALAGVVKLGYTLPVLPLVVASAILTIIDEDINRPLRAVLDDWVDSAPYSKDD